MGNHGAKQQREGIYSDSSYGDFELYLALSNYFVTGPRYTGARQYDSMSEYSRPTSASPRMKSAAPYGQMGGMGTGQQQYNGYTQPQVQEQGFRRSSVYDAQATNVRQPEYGFPQRPTAYAATSVAQPRYQQGYQESYQNRSPYTRGENVGYYQQPRDQPRYQQAFQESYLEHSPYARRGAYQQQQPQQKTYEEPSVHQSQGVYTRQPSGYEYSPPAQKPSTVRGYANKVVGGTEAGIGEMVGSERVVGSGEGRAVAGKEQIQVARSSQAVPASSTNVAASPPTSGWNSPSSRDVDTGSSYQQGSALLQEQQ